MSLRQRLTGLTALIVLVMSSLLGLALSLTASAMQFGSIDDNLRATVAAPRVRGLIANARPIPADVYNTVAVVLISADGRETTLRPAGYGSSPLPLPTLDWQAVAAARQGAVTVGSDPAYRALATTANRRGQTVVVLTPLTTVREQLARLNRVVVVAIIGITAIGTLLAWLLIGRALRPVRVMVASAQSIADGDLDRRVPAARAGTEMGDLAHALNTMISALIASVAEVRDSEERLRAFVSDASHELRTPLTVIRGYSEVLERTMLDPDEVQSRALARIGSESARLEALISELLTLQRAATVPDSESTCDLAVVCREVFGAFADLHPDRQVTIDVEPVIVRGAAITWTQVASNLAQNIDRYTPDGSAVQVRVLASAGHCSLTVDDGGPGVPAGRRAEMLERFTRMDDSRSVQTGGAGLGLSIVRALVQAHGGAVTLAQSPTGGLRVSIEVPLASEG